VRGGLFIRPDRWRVPVQLGKGVRSVRRMTTGQSGFTLVELLIVVALIALLVAIIVPSLGRARAWSRLVLCQTRLCSQAKAHFLYGADHGDAKAPILFGTGPRAVWDWTSPNTKFGGRPVGQGILVSGNYLAFDALLCPSFAMLEDTALDRENWDRQYFSGSSYEYYWRHPFAEPGEQFDILGKEVTYWSAMSAGRPGLAMDINAEEGHLYSGAYDPGQRLEPHPVLGRANVSYIGGHVGTYDSEEVMLLSPGRRDQKLLWWDEVHGRH